MHRPGVLAAQLLLALACAGHAASATPLETASSQPLATTLAESQDTEAQTRLRALERAGRARPLPAAEALGRLVDELGHDDPLRLEALLLRGLLLARGRSLDAAERVALALDAAAPRSTLAGAGAALVRAEADRLAGRLPSAERHASQALDGLPAQASAAMRLRFLVVAGTVQDDAGRLEAAVACFQQAVLAADEVADEAQRASMRNLLAYALYQGGELEAARRLNDEALAIAGRAGDDLVSARAWNTHSILLQQAGSADEAKAMARSIAHARRADAPAEEALFLANLADLHLQRGEYTVALAVARQALPLVRELKDLSGEVVALANAGLALISMKRLDEGKRLVEEAIAIDRRRGALLGESQMLEEFGRYLEKAGDARGALDAYLRHRQLADELLQRDTREALLRTQEAFDDERRTRALALLERDNQLKTRALEQGELRQRAWTLAAASAVLAGLIALSLLLHQRSTNRRLSRRNDELRAVGARDPLTGLANRRALHEAMARLTRAGRLEGSLFIVDVDDFKRINDEAGHALGDAVLVEVARRLREAVRGSDLLVRWGGEEFVVLTAARGQDLVEALARRLLTSVGETPLAVEGHARTVTVSVGFASLPDESQPLVIDGGSALNLVDAALLLAKRRGRNRACGVRLLPAVDAAGLAEVAINLEAAAHDGRVRLSLLQGPVVVASHPAPDAGGLKVASPGRAGPADAARIANGGAA